MCNLYIRWISPFQRVFSTIPRSFPSPLKGLGKAGAQNLDYFINARTYASSITASNAALVRDLSLTATGHCSWSRERVWNTSAKSPRYPTVQARSRWPMQQDNYHTSTSSRVLLLSSFLFPIVPRRRLALRGVRKTTTFPESTLSGDFQGFFASATGPDVMSRYPCSPFWTLSSSYRHLKIRFYFTRISTNLLL